MIGQHAAMRKNCGLSSVSRVLTILLAAILLIAASSTARRQLQVDSYAFAINHHEVSDLFFLNSSAGWMTLADHDHGQFYLFHTVDGGKTWTQRKAPDGVFRIWFVSKSLGWAFTQVNGNHDSEQVYLLRTENGGRAWASVSPVPVTSQSQTAYSRASLAFLDGLHGWFVGSSAQAPVFETSDGGTTIREVHDLPFKGNVQQVYAKQGDGAWILGLGFVWNLRNLGRTWSSPVNLASLDTSAFAFNVSGIFFSKDGHGWLAGQDPNGMILRTKDYGRNWQRVLDDQEIDNFSSIWFWDRMNGCAAGYPTFLTCTQDGGSTWSSRDVLPAAKGEQSELFSSLVILRSGRGWLLRSGGYLYKTDDGGKAWQTFDPLIAN